MIQDVLPNGLKRRILAKKERSSREIGIAHTVNARNYDTPILCRKGAILPDNTRSKYLRPNRSTEMLVLV